MGLQEKSAQGLSEALQQAGPPGVGEGDLLWEVITLSLTLAGPCGLRPSGRPLLFLELRPHPSHSAEKPKHRAEDRPGAELEWPLRRW